MGYIKSGKSEGATVHCGGGYGCNEMSVARTGSQIKVCFSTSPHDIDKNDAHFLPEIFFYFSDFLRLNLNSPGALTLRGPVLFWEGNCDRRCTRVSRR